jgi:hypothetical protein
MVRANQRKPCRSTSHGFKSAASAGGQINFRFSESMSRQKFLKIKNISLPFSPKSRA